MAPTKSIVFTSPLPVYKATSPTKTVATAMTFYFWAQLCYYVVYFHTSFHSRIQSVPAMAAKNGSNWVWHLHQPATRLRGRPPNENYSSMIFYFYTQLCFYMVYFSTSFHSRFRAIPAMAIGNGSNWVYHHHHPATCL